MEPKIFIDAKNDSASIKIKEGNEAKSFEKDDFIFCEDKDGNVIEVQILNFNDLAKLKDAA